MEKHMCWGWNPILWEANTPPYVFLQKYSLKPVKELFPKPSHF